MLVNTNNLVSITEANQNFSRVARLVEKNGAVVILKNGAPQMESVIWACSSRPLKLRLSLSTAFQTIQRRKAKQRVWHSGL